MNQEKEYRFVKLVEGGSTYVIKSHILGYCKYPEHPGAVTKTILKKHACDAKNCIFFRKCAGAPYWAREARLKEEKQRIKVIKKQKKANPVSAAPSPVKTPPVPNYKKDGRVKVAQGIVRKRKYQLKIVSVEKTSKKGEPNTYLISYISDCRWDDCTDYPELTTMFNKVFVGTVIMRRVCGEDGKPVMLSSNP